MSKRIDVTVVICTYNRADMLRDALWSIVEQQTHDRFEYDVLVVDNASTDDTQSIVETVARQSHVPIRCVEETKPGVANARNLGVREATGQWLAFFDDDQTADRCWLGELWRVAQEKQARCVGGAIRLDLPTGVPGLSAVCRRMFGETELDGAVRPYRGKITPGTGNLLIHRSVIEETGAFDETRKEAGEDTELFRRIQSANIPAWYTPRAVVSHRIPAYRLRPEYLRWSSERIGWSFSVRDRSNHGTLGVVARSAARLAQAVLLHLPRLAWAAVVSDRVSAMGWRCSLWRAAGYLRGTLHAVAAPVFRQQQFRLRHDFRSERHQFSQK